MLPGAEAALKALFRWYLTHRNLGSAEHIGTCLDAALAAGGESWAQLISDN